MGWFGDFIGAVGDCIGNAVSSFSNGVSLVVDSISGAMRGIADGIKSICDSIGTEGMLIIGSIALSLIIPGFGLPELLTLIQIVGAIAKALSVDSKDTPEETGMKAEIADKKPDDFESTEAYLKYLSEEVKLPEGTKDKLTTEEKVKYGLIGAALDIKAIQEKYKIELSPDFLKDVTLLKMDSEEVGSFVKNMKDNGITNMQDMTNYLKEEQVEADKSQIRDSMTETIKELYPEISEDQIEEKFKEMENKLSIQDN